MKISAFVLVTNAIKFQYPFIESIKSWLPTVDELVVIDGGSTDGTIEAIEAIGDSKIRIVSDEDTRWEEEWEYSRMGKNFNRGYNECTGDIVFKFDADYILHERTWKDPISSKFNLRTACEIANKQNAMIIGFVRRNLSLTDRFFYKKQKTLGVNRIQIKKHNISIAYGIDYARWKWGYEPIVVEQEKHDIKFGSMVNVQGNTFISDIDVWNYGLVFCDKPTVKWIRQRHIKAEVKQQKKKYDHIKPTSIISLEGLETNKNFGLENHITSSLNYLRKRSQTIIKIEEHPEVIQNKIKNLTPDKQGYNFWGLYEKSKYYEKN